MTEHRANSSRRPASGEGSADTSRRTSQGRDAPIELADTDQIGGEDTPARSGAGSGESAGSGSAAGRSASSPGASSAGGVSTGGFDTVLGKLVVQRGLATSEEVEMCHAMLRESSGDSDNENARTLADMLLENDFLTERQLRRVRTEFEANKSSQQIPGYKIKRKLGSGAMATVFLAKQMSLDRLVAIKVLPKKFSSNEKFIERFYKEGKAAAQLNHPNIVGAYDVGKAGEHHYFVMEYVDGTTVYDRIVKEKRVSEKEAIHIIRQAAEALRHAHERGFIHRDIKPKNIMINKDGVVKLADLGLARAVSDKEAAEAEAGRAYGTPYYISPEQIRGERTVGPPADIYGLGATFYHMVAGRVPFEGKNPSEVMHRHLKSDLKPPDHINPKLSSACAEVIEMMMAKRIEDRYQTVDDLMEDLKLIAEGKSPHFAGRGLSFSGLTSELDVPDEPKQPAPPHGQHAASGASVTSSPAFMVVLVVMLASLLVNVVLALLLATG